MWHEAGPSQAVGEIPAADAGVDRVESGLPVQQALLLVTGHEGTRSASTLRADLGLEPACRDYIDANVHEALHVPSSEHLHAWETSRAIPDQGRPNLCDSRDVLAGRGG
jgi:hypothetical protein